MIRLWIVMPMTEKCKQPEYKRRNFEGLAPLTHEIQAIAKPILGMYGFVSVDILRNWEEIVGEDLAKGIRPEKLTFDKDKRTNGTLHVKSAGGAFAMLFEHQKARVIERINTFFGYPAVKNIKIRQGALKLAQPSGNSERLLTPIEQKTLTARVADIEDPELRERVYRIGEELLKKS